MQLLATDIGDIKLDAAQRAHLAIIEAAGYTVMDNGTGIGWFALLPGETAIKDDDDNDNFYGFFSSLTDLIDEMKDTLLDDILAKTDMTEERWASMRTDGRILFAGNLPFQTAETEARRLFDKVSSKQDDIPDEISALLANDDWRIMFHGTASEIENFAGEWVPGGDCNSALGTHFSEWPISAMEYAEVAHERGEGDAPWIIVAAVPATNPCRDYDDYYAFFGFGEDREQVVNHEGFAAIRTELIAKGYDIVDYEDGEDVISVVLQPEKIRILARLTPAAAEVLYDRIQQLDNQFSGRERLRLVEEILAEERRPNIETNVRQRATP